MARHSIKTIVKNGILYYYDRIYLNRDPVTGKWKYKDVYGRTIDEFKEKKNKLVRQIEEGINITDKSKFGSFFESWLYNIHFIDKKPATIERYEGIYRNHLKSAPFMNLKTNKINTLHIQEFLNALNLSGASISTIEMIIKVVNPALRYAFDQGLTIKNYGSSLKKPSNRSIEKKEIEVLTLDEQKIFIDSLKNNKERVLYITALGSGLRVGELLALKWTDIDFDNSKLKVSKSIKRVKLNGKYQIIEQLPKTQNSIRTVPIPLNVLNLLIQHKELQEMHKKTALDAFNDNNLAFCTDFGTWIDANNLNKRFKKILSLCNINKGSSFHSLRHTYATRLLENGVDFKTLQTLMGHSDIRITMNTYAHVLDSFKDTSVSKINHLFEI